MKTEFIFVYGTLRKKTATNMCHLLARYCDFFSEGQMSGELYEVDGYPGAVETNDESKKIYGELYKINNADIVLPTLDEYEECTENFPEPHEYIRKKLPVTSLEGGDVIAWVYIYNHDIDNLEKIYSGDYLPYSKQKST